MTLAQRQQLTSGADLTERCDREAYCTVGYSPFLSFTVSELQATLTQLLQLGGTMDGGIKHMPRGMVRFVSSVPRPFARSPIVLCSGRLPATSGRAAVLQTAAMRAPDGHMISLFEPAER